MHILYFFMIFHEFHRLPLLHFLLLFLWLEEPNLNCYVLILKLTGSFRCFFKSAIETLLNSSVNFVLQLQNFCLIVLCFLSLCWTSHFVVILFPWFYRFLYFLLVLWTSLEQLFWILRKAIHVFLFWGLITGSLLCYFDGVMFPWFFMIPVALHVCLYIWRSTYFL